MNDSFPGQDRAEFITCELFISGLFHLILWTISNQPQVAETVESETTDNVISNCSSNVYGATAM